MRSCWGKLAIGFGLILILLFGLWLYFDIKYQHMIDVELARIRAEGWPVTAAECAPEPVLDAQNAAVLYQQVFQIDFDAPDPWGGSDLLPDIDYDLVRTFREEPTSEIERQVRTLLTDPETTKVLDILREAAERPYSVFPIRWEQWPEVLPFGGHHGKFRKTCHLISLRALASARAERIGEALDWCRVGLRISEHGTAEHTLIAQLISIAMNSIIIGNAEEFLDTAAVSPQDARRMEDYLRQIDLRAHFTNAMITERALGLAGFRVFHDNPTICYYSFCPVYQQYIPDEFFEMLSGCPDFLSEVTVKTYCSRFGWPLQKLDQLHYLTMMREQIELSKQPYRLVKTRYDAQQRALEDMPSYQVPGTRILTPVYGRAAAKRGYSIAQIALFRVVLALKAYKYERRAYPESLAQLQQTLSWQLPQDPFSGNSFVYRRKGKGFKLYSLWSDLDDDGGEPIEKHRYEDGDIVWECHR